MSTPDVPPPRTSIWPRLLLLALFLVALATLSYFGAANRAFQYVRDNLDAWKTQAEDNLLLALAVFFVLYVAITALSLPIAVPLSLLAGALFGRWVGTGLVSVAATLGATLAFLSSRYLFRDWVQRRFASRLEALNRGVEKDGAFYLLTLRLVPLVPFFLINLGMGLTTMRVGTFAVVSWVGMLVGTFLYVNVGTELANLTSLSGLISWQMLLSLALLGVVPLLVRLVMRRMGRK